MPVNPLLKMLADAVNNGNHFSLRNDPVGRLWQKELDMNKDMKAKYTAAKGWKAKEAIRVDWLATKYDSVKNEKTHYRAWQKVDATKGELLNFGLLVESFGILYNRAAAIESATKHASKCMQMKGNWIHWDSMGEVACFLKLRQVFSEEMTECWKLCETESITNDANASADAGQPASQSGSVVVVNSPQRAPSEANDPRCRQRKQQNTEPPATRPVKKTRTEKTELELALIEAGKTKALYTSVVVRAENLVGQIDASATWAWARTPDSVGSLRTFISQIKDKVTPSVARFVMEEIKMLETELGAETLLMTAKAFNSMKSDIVLLSDKVTSLIKAHNALNKS